MISDHTLQQLDIARSLVTALVEDLDDQAYRAQHHPEMSPPGWHLGHCMYTECYWLHEKLRGDSTMTRPLEQFYTPPHTPKAERGPGLPPLKDMLEWVKHLQDYNNHYLRGLPPELVEHDLMKDDYLLHFLIQHYAQHYENLLMILSRRALDRHQQDYSVRTPLQARRPAASADRAIMHKGHYRVGGQPPLAYDNELPSQEAQMGEYRIAVNPVSNAEYLAFMQEGGYTREQYWDQPGLAWLRDSAVAHPELWQRDAQGHWYGVGVRGAYDLAKDEPVSGINYFEASAYARWAGGKLPHEYQWEAACRLNMLRNTGRAWEWCENAFHPYAGFTAFPYDAYSTPWFDGHHYTLKGGSLYTRPQIKRPSFRNFYQPDKRHIFAGVRLVY